MSLTSLVGKLLGEILRNKSTLCLDRQRLIRDRQHGFVCKKLCCTIWSFFEDVMERIDKARAVEIVYSKAFDKVPHGSLICWITRDPGWASYLDTKLSWWKESDGGSGELLFRLEDCNQWCATGIMLGSLLFVSYVKDLDDNVMSLFNKSVKRII